MVCAADPAIDFYKLYISACSLCVVGGMALLMTWVDPDTIRLVGE